jgi:hypothetical protein
LVDQIHAINVIPSLIVLAQKQKRVPIWVDHQGAGPLYQAIV